MPRREVTAGLDRAMLLPTGKGYVEASAGATHAAGLYGRLEAGYRPIAPLAAFGFGQVDQQNGWQVGAGARLTF